MDTYLIDGVAMDDGEGRWCLTDATVLPSWGSPRLINVEVPGRMGVAGIAPVSADPATLVMGLMVTDSGGGRAGLDANLRSLGALVRRMGRLLSVEHRLDDGVRRMASGRLQAVSTPELYPRDVVATMTITLEIPSGVWRDPTVSEASASDLGVLDGGVMPIPDALVLVSSVTGPVTVTDVASGALMRFTGAPVAGKSLLLDPTRYRASWTAGSWSHSGGTDASGDLSLGAGGFALCPDMGGHHALTVTGGVARVRAARAY